jgi:hypothetical protein
VNITGTDLIYVIGRSGAGAGETLLITDNQTTHLTWNSLFGNVGDNSGNTANAWYAQGVGAITGLTVTVSDQIGNTATMSVGLLAFTGVASASALDVSCDAVPAGSLNTSVSCSLSPSVAGDLVIGGTNGASGSGTWTAGTGLSYTLVDQNSRSMTEWATKSGTGATTVDASESPATSLTMIAAAFKAASGGSTCRHTLPLAGDGCS